MKPSCNALRTKSAVDKIDQKSQVNTHEVQRSTLCSFKTPGDLKKVTKQGVQRFPVYQKHQTGMVKLHESACRQKCNKVASQAICQENQAKADECTWQHGQSSSSGQSDEDWRPEVARSSALPEIHGDCFAPLQLLSPLLPPKRRGRHIKARFNRFRKGSPKRLVLELEPDWPSLESEQPTSVKQTSEEEEEGEDLEIFV